MAAPQATWTQGGIKRALTDWEMADLAEEERRNYNEFLLVPRTLAGKLCHLCTLATIICMVLAYFLTPVRGYYAGEFAVAEEVEAVRQRVAVAVVCVLVQA